VSTATFWERAGHLSDEIRAEARALDPVKVAFTLLMLPFVALGFAAAKAVVVAWQVLAFCWVACLTGWRKAGGGGDTWRTRRPKELGG
jgi:hypothetical protein